MNSIIRNVLAVVCGLVLGSVVNMALVSTGPYVIPLPEGADVTDMEKLAESMHLMKPANFVFPFLAHALGTLAGAFATAKVAATRKRTLAMVIGGAFLLGGIAAASMIGGPAWFNAVDLLLAYIPMGWLGGRLGAGR